MGSIEKISCPFSGWTVLINFKPLLTRAWEDSCQVQLLLLSFQEKLLLSNLSNLAFCDDCNNKSDVSREGFQRNTALQHFWQNDICPSNFNAVAFCIVIFSVKNIVPFWASLVTFRVQKLLHFGWKVVTIRFHLHQKLQCGVTSHSSTQLTLLQCLLNPNNSVSCK